MDYSAVVGVDLEWGHRIVQELESAGLHIPIAFWAKLAEYDQWRFFLASPEFDRMGLFQAYASVLSSGKAEEPFQTPLVTILDMEDPLVKGLQQRLRRDLPTRGLRVTGQAFGARAIEDGILERVA